MTFIAELEGHVRGLSGMRELDVEASELVSCVERLSDDALVSLMEQAARLRSSADRLSVVAAGVVARRSSRDRGYAGLATTRGHRTPAGLIQSITGGTAAAAKKAVQVGEALLEGAGSSAVGPSGAGDVGADAGDVGAPAAPERGPWHAPLGRALLDGLITVDQHDAIRTGLGEPPAGGEVDSEVDVDAAVHEVWSIAAGQLVDEAASASVEELRARARAVRDALDPAGAEERFASRYAARSFRMWIDKTGQHHGHFVFDDDAAAWVRSMMDAALRPRRGGPRFVDSAEKAKASELSTDERSNEQLAYDLVFDVLRAGSLASSDDVFGARQPGVRVVVVDDPDAPRDLRGRLGRSGYTEDHGIAVPGSLVDRAVCESGVVRTRFDRTGNPLDLGREQRLFGRAQRIMLAIRDGGCRWPGCSRPPSYCEAHHCDHWQADHGRTDVDRGILLCRHHHLLLHNNGWKIVRRGTDPFVLHAPSSSGIPPAELTSKAPWAWVWDPPPPPEGRASWRTRPSAAPV